MKVLYVASEALPFMASGGLGDVAGSLPVALRKRLIGCRVVMPLYIFKGVKVEKGAVVKNSILMQDTVIGENAKVNCVIADKNVSIKSSAELSGANTFPVCLAKNTRV